MFGRRCCTPIYWANASFWIGWRIKVTLRRGGRKFGAGKRLPGQLQLGVRGGAGEEAIGMWP
jgi:hypothetical protein